MWVYIYMQGREDKGARQEAGVKMTPLSHTGETETGKAKWITRTEGKKEMVWNRSGGRRQGRW